MKITKDHLFKLGQLIWPFTYGLADDDAGAARALLTRATEGVAQRHGYWTLLASELLLPQNQLAYSGSALWCHQGFPQIVMGHKYAAALMATKLSHDVAEQVRPPWRSFFIEVPHGLLFVEDNLLNRQVTVTGILVSSMFHAPSGANRWAYFAITEAQATIWMHGAATEHLIGDHVEGVWEGTGLTEPLETLDKRCSTMIGRLRVVGSRTCSVATSGSSSWSSPWCSSASRASSRSTWSADGGSPSCASSAAGTPGHSASGSVYPVASSSGRPDGSRRADGVKIAPSTSRVTPETTAKRSSSEGSS
jgi:hypothetical protein